LKQLPTVNDGWYGFQMDDSVLVDTSTGSGVIEQVAAAITRNKPINFPSSEKKHQKRNSIQSSLFFGLVSFQSGKRLHITTSTSKARQKCCGEIQSK
jgi:hypothetical protein